jgi:hypothetical protein
VYPEKGSGYYFTIVLISIFGVLNLFGTILTYIFGDIHPKLKKAKIVESTET